MAENAMVIAAHPLYPPNLGLFDFYLLRHVRGLPRGKSFEAGERLLSAVEGILGSFEKWTLTKVFLEWMTRPERCIETDGDYVGQPKINISAVIGLSGVFRDAPLRWNTRYNPIVSRSHPTADASAVIVF
jgi:hypothetical protein